MALKAFFIWPIYTMLLLGTKWGGVCKGWAYGCMVRRLGPYLDTYMLINNFVWIPIRNEMFWLPFVCKFFLQHSAGADKIQKIQKKIRYSHFWMRISDAFAAISWSMNVALSALSESDYCCDGFHSKFSETKASLKYLQYYSIRRVLFFFK